MSSSFSVSTWVGLLKAGDQAAATALWQRYYAQLVELASRHLARHVRQVGDEEDVALAAFADFCAGAASGRFPDLTNREGLWRLLLTLTLRKARDHAKHEGRDKRNAARTTRAGDLFDLPEADLDRLASEAPDPALAVEVADELRHLLALLPGADLREVAHLLLAGYTSIEIAERLACSLRTIERRRNRIRQFWGETVDDFAADVPASQ